MANPAKDELVIPVLTPEEVLSLGALREEVFNGLRHDFLLLEMMVHDRKAFDAFRRLAFKLRNYRTIIDM